LNTSIDHWRRQFFNDVQRSVAYAEGRVLHLWHGQTANRAYLDRTEILRSCGYDPEHDIKASPEGPWQWSSQKTQLHARVRAYFESRKEDE